MKTSFSQRFLVWLVITFFIYSTLFPILVSTVFSKDVTKIIVKTTPVKINTYVCYENKKAKEFHSTGCRYIGKKDKISTVYESLSKGYKECEDCDMYERTPTELIIETTTKQQVTDKEYNFFYVVAICSLLSFLLFIPMVLVPMRKENNCI